MTTTVQSYGNQSQERKRKNFSWVNFPPRITHERVLSANSYGPARTPGHRAPHTPGPTYGCQPALVSRLSHGGNAMPRVDAVRAVGRGRLHYRSTAGNGGTRPPRCELCLFWRWSLGSAEERCAHFPDSPAPAPPISAHRKRPAARDGRPRHITLRMTEMDNAVELAAPMAKAEVGGSHDDASVSLEVSEIIE